MATNMNSQLADTLEERIETMDDGSPVQLILHCSTIEYAGQVVRIVRHITAYCPYTPKFYIARQPNMSYFVDKICPLTTFNKPFRVFLNEERVTALNVENALLTIVDATTNDVWFRFVTVTKGSFADRLIQAHVVYNCDERILSLFNPGFK